MPRTTALKPEQVPADSKPTLDAFTRNIEFTPNMMATFAQSPIAFNAWATLLDSLSKALDVKTRDSIGLAVSEVNGCNYCLTVHSFTAEHMARLPGDEIILARKGHASDPKRDAAVQFARKVIQTRGEISDADMEAVRDAGYTDANVMEIVALVAMYSLTNFFNNVFDPEKDLPPRCAGWLNLNFPLTIVSRPARPGGNMKDEDQPMGRRRKPMKIRTIIATTCAALGFSMAGPAYALDVAVIVYDGVLTSDITAPLEVFGNAARKPWLQKINVEAVSADGDLDILTEEGIKLKADRLLAEAPSYDVIIVPSSYDMDTVLGNRALIDFIRDQSKTADWMASNCSGALVLAEAGVLDGKRATTWAGGEALFQKNYPDVLVQHDINVVIDDGVLTSNGSIVSYEAAITLLAKLTSDEFAAEVANDLQFKRVADAVLPPRLHWKLASVVATAAFLFGAFVAGLTLLIRTRRTKR